MCSTKQNKKKKEKAYMYTILFRHQIHKKLDPNCLALFLLLQKNNKYI